VFFEKPEGINRINQLKITVGRCQIFSHQRMAAFKTSLNLFVYSAASSAGAASAGAASSAAGGASVTTAKVYLVRGL
jgi:hypothetical protein